MKIFPLEKAIRALFLAEQLKVHGLDFLFKGGTSLSIQLQTPQRFSIDVDIVTTDIFPTLANPPPIRKQTSKITRKPPHD